MGTNLRLYWNHAGLTYPVEASGADAAYPVANLESGNLWRYWKGVSTAEHVLTWVAPVGSTISLDAVVIPAAALLVAAGANVALQRTDDNSVWIDVWTLTPILTAHLAAPDARHYVREETSTTARRGWRLRFYGSMTSPPMVAGGVFLGARSELPVQPSPDRLLQVNRPHRGAEITASFPPMTPADADTIATVIAAVTPDAAEGFHQTVSGVGYGGRPHWMYDPTGDVISRVNPRVATLHPVLCVTPEAAESEYMAPTLEQPVTVRWRVRR